MEESSKILRIVSVNDKNESKQNLKIISVNTEKINKTVNEKGKMSLIKESLELDEPISPIVKLATRKMSRFEMNHTLQPKLMRSKTRFGIKGKPKKKIKLTIDDKSIDTLVRFNTIFESLNNLKFIVSDRRKTLILTLESNLKER